MYKQPDLMTLMHHKNAQKTERLDKIGNILHNCFQKAQSVDSWVVQDRHGNPLPVKNKGDLDELIVKPALLRIAKNEVTAKDCYKFVTKQFLTQENKAGDEVRFKLKYLKSTLYNLEGELSTEKKFKERRDLFAEFYSKFLLDDVSYEDEITEISLHPRIQDMLSAVEEYILLSLGSEFIYYYLHVILAYGQDTLLSKAPGTAQFLYY
jgi:hypothetical protein